MAQPSSFVLPRQGKYHKYGSRELSSLIDRKVALGFAKVSGKYVGAVGVGSSGIAYLGINIELPGLHPRYSIHAVQFLVTNLALHGEPNLTYLAFSADDTNFVAPCDNCLYFLQEINEPPKLLIKNPAESTYVTHHSLVRKLSEYKTHPFPDLAHILDVCNNKLTLLDADGEDPDVGMKRMALAAANRSFAPYSNCPSGVALKDGDQKVYLGWYMESIASIASVGPVQAALVHFMIKGGTKFEDIVEAVLVEKKDADRSQVTTSTKILETIAPNCAVTVLYCLESVKA